MYVAVPPIYTPVKNLNISLTTKGFEMHNEPNTIAMIIEQMAKLSSIPIAFMLPLFKFFNEIISQRNYVFLFNIWFPC